MNKEYVCVLIKPKKYIELLNYDMYNVRPLKQEKRTEYGTFKTETIYNLPFEITNDIDEDIKMLTKKEYEEYEKEKIKNLNDFMQNYEPDYMWNNLQQIIEENKKLKQKFEILGGKENE